MFRGRVRKTRESWKGGKGRRRTSFAGGSERECRCEYSRYRVRNETRSERLENERRERRKKKDADGRVAHAFNLPRGRSSRTRARDVLELLSATYT
jgi:hypothetical protein